MPAPRADHTHQPASTGQTPQTARWLSWEVPEDATFGHECAWPFLAGQDSGAQGEADANRLSLPR